MKHGLYCRHVPQTLIDEINERRSWSATTSSTMKCLHFHIFPWLNRIRHPWTSVVNPHWAWDWSMSVVLLDEPILTGLNAQFNQESFEPMTSCEPSITARIHGRLFIFNSWEHLVWFPPWLALSFNSVNRIELKHANLYTQSRRGLLTQLLVASWCLVFVRSPADSSEESQSMHKPNTEVAKVCVDNIYEIMHIYSLQFCSVLVASDQHTGVCNLNETVDNTQTDSGYGLDLQLYVCCVACLGLLSNVHQKNWRRSTAFETSVFIPSLSFSFSSFISVHLILVESLAS